MKNFISSGNTLSLAAPYAVVSGAGALVGATFGVASTDLANGIVGEFAVVGVFELAKTSANTPAAGAKAYWNDTAKEITTTSTSNTLVGVFTVAAGNGDLVAQVRLNGSF